MSKVITPEQYRKGYLIENTRGFCRGRRKYKLISILDTGDYFVRDEEPNVS